MKDFDTFTSKTLAEYCTKLIATLESYFSYVLGSFFLCKLLLNVESTLL